MSPDFLRKRAAGMALIKKYHGPLKPRSDGPAWHHLDRVSKVLELVLEETGEGPAEERETIVLSALGTTQSKIRQWSAVSWSRSLVRVGWR